MTRRRALLLRLGVGAGAGLLAGHVAAQTPPAAAPASPASPAPRAWGAAPAAPWGASAPAPGGPAVSAPGQPPGGAGWWSPPPRPVTLILRSTEPGVTIEVYPKGGAGAPLVSCPADCQVALPAGDYRFKVLAGQETVGGTRELSVSGDQEVVFDPDTTQHRWGGLAMGIGGPVLMVAGVVGLVGCSLGGCGEDWEALTVVGLLGGITITPVGWVLFGTSFKPEYEVRALGRRAADCEPGVRAARANAGGRPLGLGLTVAF